MKIIVLQSFFAIAKIKNAKIEILWDLNLKNFQLQKISVLRYNRLYTNVSLDAKVPKSEVFDTSCCLELNHLKLHNFFCHYIHVHLYSSN